ncbi:polysaccharide deacetylase family protein [Sporomusa sphaeroides]|jgi:polysaccharide deacetylase family sporulation protein PdaB|uniref:polysaccharide deacetylase family protein n=1 Tax=Sporomusa sphaeroides TaxID=47679 RepID=UPI002BE749C4|nr:polysaccharide deacetylase family protein [Sporomusa sphaeroides]HML35148.1 polysaccharide deacetylase family protein [Sporomusa sphaeroides]
MTDLHFRLNSTLAILTGIVIFLLFLDYLQVVRRPRVGLYLALLAIVWGGYVTFNAVWPTSTFYGSIEYQGCLTEKVVALTFDDGPNPPYTTELLNLLDRENVKATFFLIGQNVERYPDIVRDIARRGYVIGSHTFSHSDLLKLDDQQIAWEMDQSLRVIEQATGNRPHLLRPPHGFRDAAILEKAKERNLKVIQWSVMAEDWKKPGIDIIAERVVNKVKNGSIVLLHDGDGVVSGGDRSQSIAATAKIIRRLQEQGYRFVTVDEILDSHRR